MSTKSKFEVAMCKDEQEAFLSAIRSDYEHINKLIATIYVEQSEASWNPLDHERIFACVTQTNRLVVSTK